MTRIELLDFQRSAADKLVNGALDYFAEGQDKIEGRYIPYVGQLKAVTGAGKTPILCNVISELGNSIILWTTKFGSVVDQTVTNLRVGGKYHHLLGGGDVEVIRFSDIPSLVEWERILSKTSGITVLVSTVAAWNSSEKDDRLNVHRIRADWGTISRWEQLKTERKRKLWVVYDEAHNTTSEQVELLDELDPAGFFVASASPIKGKLQHYLTLLSEDARKRRIVPVSTRAVVEAQLLKSTISIADYDSSYEEMLADVTKRRDLLQGELQAQGSSTVPKAIYVVETSNAAGQDSVSRPIAIWNALTSKCNVHPSNIAVCTNTKNLPKDAIKVDTINQLSDNFTHIIFNKKLQEGWDDPSVYVCYFDGKTDSATRIQQVLGRALRQPNAQHLSNEELNTAYFYINCPNEALDRITDQLKEELSIYKGDDAPDDFEPFTYKNERRSLPNIPLKPEYVGKLSVSRLQLELPLSKTLAKIIQDNTFNFGADDCAAPGRALVNVVSVKTGDVGQLRLDLFEEMRVRCGSFLHDQIRIQSRNCANSLPTSLFSNAKLDITACYKSRAIEHYRSVANQIVREYENHVKLVEFIDPQEKDYIVGEYQPKGATTRVFARSAHEYYDTKSFNDDELALAKALDNFNDGVWVRNRERLDYGIMLPIKSGSSNTFYPDFLWWIKNTVWVIDPTGKFILEEKIRTKLLNVPEPIKIALITRGQYDSQGNELAGDGWTLSYRRMGATQSETFNNLDDILETLSSQS